MEFKKPLGALMNEDEAIAAANASKKMVIAVGDECARTLINAKAHLDVVVYDLRCMREPVDEETKNGIEEFARANFRLSVKNPAGSITDELEDAVKKVVEQGRGSVFVEGEEDLATLLAVIQAPVGALVLYGQPREGIVAIRVDKRSKDRITRMLEEMERSA